MLTETQEKQTLEEMRQMLQDQQLLIVYLTYDLECTRRERDSLLDDFYGRVTGNDPRD